MLYRCTHWSLVNITCTCLSGLRRSSKLALIISTNCGMSQEFSSKYLVHDFHQVPGLKEKLIIKFKTSRLRTGSDPVYRNILNRTTALLGEQTAEIESVKQTIDRLDKVISSASMPLCCQYRIVGLRLGIFMLIWMKTWFDQIYLWAVGKVLYFIYFLWHVEIIPFLGS